MPFSKRRKNNCRDSSNDRVASENSLLFYHLPNSTALEMLKSIDNFNRLVFYDDASTFGGHEVSVLTALEYILMNTNWDVYFILYKGNRRLLEYLQELSEKKRELNLVTIPYSTPVPISISSISSYLKFSVSLNNILTKLQPSLVIAVQGNVTLSFAPLLIAKLRRIKSCSFIPMAKPLSFVDARSIILSALYKGIYSLPDKFITTSSSAQSCLINCGINSVIDVVYYGPDIEKCKLHDRNLVRQKLGLSDSEYVFAIIGRIQFQHKAHDFLVKTLAHYRDKFDGCKLCIVGDGPDSNALRQIVDNLEMNEFVVFIPWINDLSEIYSVLDMLLIPSLHEGVPLVMLEAMYYTIPIVASNVGGMIEILPSEWIFNCGDANSMVEVIDSVRSSDQATYLNYNKDKISTQFNSLSFGCNFTGVLLDHG